MQAFGPWRPDYPNQNSQFAGEALGVLPGNDSYRPFPSLVAVSLAVAARVNAAFVSHNSDGSVSFFVGTDVRLYKFAGATTAWTNVTRTVGGDYGVISGERWQFAQFGDTVFASARGVVTQSIDSIVGTNFAAATGTPPKAKIIKNVGDFMMFGDTDGSRYGIRWSGRNDATYYTNGQRNADLQQFPAEEGGFVTGIAPLTAGPLQGLILREQSVWRFVETTSYGPFNFAPMLHSQGTQQTYSIILHNSTALYRGTAGFVSCDMGGEKEIGNGWVDEWFNSTAATTRVREMVGVLDPIKHRYIWAFHGTANATGYMDQLICFDPLATWQWSHAEINASTIFSAASPGYTLEDLDALYPSLDAMDISLDSFLFAGGAPLLGGFTSANKMGFFTGANMAATVQTPRFQPIPGKRSYVSGFRPVTDASSVTGRVGVAERMQDTVTFGSSQSLTAQGFIPARASGRDAQFEVSIASGQVWNSLQGVDFGQDDLSEDGER